MAHGAGGKATGTLIEGLLVPAFASAALAELADAGSFEVDGAPWRSPPTASSSSRCASPGGSIGELAVNGTVNDLAVAGARPVALTVSLILEEGLDARDPARRGRGDRRRRARRGRDRRGRHEGRRARPRRRHVRLHDRASGAATRGRACRRPPCVPGDRILVSGPIGEHGTAIMLARGELGLSAEIESDTQPLWPTVDALLDAAGGDVRCLRDATRGGVASVLNELARASGVAILVREADVPVARTSPAPRRSWASTRCTWPTRAGRGLRGARVRRGGARRAALGARRRPGGRDRRGAHGAARDGARANRLRRHAGHGPAGRRPAPRIC